MKKKILAGFASALTLLALAGCNQTQPAETTAPSESSTDTPPVVEEPAPSTDTSAE